VAARRRTRSDRSESTANDMALAIETRNAEFERIAYRNS
jgi:hypothetical protein